jgi:predicted transcriptional regulator
MHTLGYMKKTAPFSIRLPIDLKEELQKLADADQRSLSNFIEVSLRRVVAEIQKGKKK